MHVKGLITTHSGGKFPIHADTPAKLCEQIRGVSAGRMSICFEDVNPWSLAEFDEAIQQLKECFSGVPARSDR